MKNYFYDMHLHSCLSPCADNDMTPYNIINYAVLSSLDIIALTDHNSCKNCPSAIEIAKNHNITLICGMELCTNEEIHVICLFPTLEKAMEFDEFVEARLPNIKNDINVFGNQFVTDKNDNIILEVDKLLSVAADISINELPHLMQKYGGACFPAHIDKHSYSVLSALGEIPPECDFKAVEVTHRGDINLLKQKHPLLNTIPLLLNSDAHYLEDINPQRAWLSLNEPTTDEVISAISGDCAGFGRG